MTPVPLVFDDSRTQFSTLYGHKAASIMSKQSHHPAACSLTPSRLWEIASGACWRQKPSRRLPDTPAVEWVASQRCSASRKPPNADADTCLQLHGSTLGSRSPI